MALHPLYKKKALILGLGMSGQSAAQFLLNRGSMVVGADRNHDKLKQDPNIVQLCKQGMQVIADKISDDLKTFDLLVVSPGVPSTHPIYQQAIEKKIPLIGEVELACREIKKKTVGITGTNGKTTVTLLTTHVLNHAGKKAKALGNVGVPLTSALDDPDCSQAEIFVIELSSFQLETLQNKFIDAGTILNITPDHLDRYPSMEKYALAKIQLRHHLKPGGKLFVEENCFKEYKHLFESASCLTYGYSQHCNVSTDTQSVYIDGKKAFALPDPYRGKRSHDLENMISAFALCYTMGISPDQFVSALTTFKKPSHRIEFVKTVRGVRYIDDSKGTNIDAVLRAIEAVEGNIVLIAGGVDKGFPYTSWIAPFTNKVKCICAIGQSAKKMQQELNSQIPVEIFSTLEQAVKHASFIAKEGEAILLSPGCSSYDMFKDYAHRGNEFKRIVMGL